MVYLTIIVTCSHYIKYFVLKFYTIRIIISVSTFSIIIYFWHVLFKTKTKITIEIRICDRKNKNQSILRTDIRDDPEIYQGG